MHTGDAIAMKPMTKSERDQLLRALEARFKKHSHRHAGVAWSEVLSRLEAAPAALKTLAAMKPPAAIPT